MNILHSTKHKTLAELQEDSLAFMEIENILRKKIMKQSATEIESAQDLVEAVEK